MENEVSDRHQRLMRDIENKMSVVNYYGLRSMLFYSFQSGNKAEDYLQRDELFRKGLAEYVKDKKFEELLVVSTIFGVKSLK